MGWLSVFKRRDDTAPAAAADAGDAVQLARTRARRRLIGAVVLVVIGVIGFPLIFETQPRPIPVDIPIEIPRKDGAPALELPAPKPAPARAAASAPAEPAPRDEVITETRADAGREVPPAASAAAASPPERVASRPAAKPVAAPASAVVAPKKAPDADAARAKALLDGKEPAASAPAGRFVLQVGAFSDAHAAHEMRLKVEKLGMKTYTQVAETAQGSRIRVRVGPFSNRDEADAALAKARSAGVSAVVLTL